MTRDYWKEFVVCLEVVLLDDLGQKPVPLITIPEE